MIEAQAGIQREYRELLKDFYAANAHYPEGLAKLRAWVSIQENRLYQRIAQRVTSLENYIDDKARWIRIHLANIYQEDYMPKWIAFEFPFKN